MEEKCFCLNDSYETRYLVSCGDIDPDYRLKYTSALAYFQDTVASYMASRGLAAFDILKKGFIWVVTDNTYASGDADALWRDYVTSAIRLTEVSPLKLFFDYELRGDDGRVFASGTGVWVPVEIATGRPAALSAFCTIRKDAEYGAPVRHGKFKYIETDADVMQVSCPVTHSELDFNNHMGNRSYIDFALRGVPDAFMETHSLKNFMVKFERQTFLGDTLVCHYCKSSDNDDVYLVRLINSKGEEACVVQGEWAPIARPAMDISSSVRRQ